MLARIVSLGLVLSLAFGIVSAEPTKGATKLTIEVPASKIAGTPGEAEIVVECRGNQKSSVMIQGDHRPVTDLEVLVYEVSSTNAEDKLIARDKGTRDLIGAVWTPPKTGVYRIVIRNPSQYIPEKNPHNRCYVTIK